MKKKPKPLTKSASFFSRASTQAITVFWLLLAASGSNHGGEDLLDRFDLVRRSDYIPECREHSNSQAMVFFRLGTHQGELRRGEEFFIITASSSPLRQKL